MGKYINSVTVTAAAMGDDAERLQAQVAALIVSHEGAIPGSRGFGLPGEFFDKPAQEAVNLLAIELEEKLGEYFPGVTAADVSAEVEDDGTLDVTVRLAGREG